MTVKRLWQIEATMEWYPDPIAMACLAGGWLRASWRTRRRRRRTLQLWWAKARYMLLRRWSRRRAALSSPRAGG